MPTAVRDGLANLMRRLPRVRGLGRVILACDRVLTNNGRPDSYQAVARLNQPEIKLRVDLRVMEQKFAYYYGAWEQELLTAVLAHYHGGAFYDVGGSIGLYAVTIGLHGRRDGSPVRTIEPMPMNLDRLRDNLALNGLDESTVTIDPRGLSDRPGSFEVALAADGIPGNAKVVKAGGAKVDVTTLDQLWADHGQERVGFIKIDTEGWDALILAGGQELLRSQRPGLLVEFNRERMHNLRIELGPVWKLLVDEIGYRCSRVDDRGALHPIDQPGDLENLLFLA